jgi:phage replication-related protein YjqB (UPF0714/DUF867 family)
MSDVEDQRMFHGILPLVERYSSRYNSMYTEILQAENIPNRLWPSSHFDENVTVRLVTTKTTFLIRLKKQNHISRCNKL